MAKSPSKNDKGEKSQNSNIWGYLQIAAILVVVAVALYFARASNRVDTLSDTISTVDDAIPVVEVFKPTTSSKAIGVETSGTVGTKNRIRVISEVTGRVSYVHPEFEAGGLVEAGELLVKIDSREYELRADEIRLQIESIQQALLQQGGQSGDGSPLSNALRLGEIELALAELEIEKTEISFPYAVRVVGSTIEVGELVGPTESVGESANLGTIYKPEDVRIVIGLSRDQVNTLEPLEGRTAIVDTGSEQFDAIIHRVSWVISSDTRNLPLVLRFSDDYPLESLPLPGTFVEINFEGDAHEDTYVLPRRTEQGNGLVWIVKDGVIHPFEPSTIGRIEEGWVVESFDFGEGIILGRYPRINEGRSVQITETPL